MTYDQWCNGCFRNFADLKLHISMSRCGRLQRNKLTADDLVMIDKLGINKAIKARKEP